MNKQDYIREFALQLVEMARENGVVLTIETRPSEPFAMGSYTMQVHTRLTRTEYAKGVL